MEKKSNEIFELHNYLNANGSPEEILEKIVRDIPQSENIGFAGYLEKKWLNNFLRGFMFDKKENNQLYLYDVKYEEDIKQMCEGAIKKCKNYINKKIYIFLFPTFDKFVTEKMGGVSGFSPWDNTIWIFVNFKNNWRESLEETIVHELAHALSPFYKGADFPIGCGLVLDGIAEHFKDFIISDKRSPWTKVVSEEKAWRIFEEIRDILKENNLKKYSEVFYGTGKYPMWAGYTIGYYLIKSYLEKQNKVDWNDILRRNPEDILREKLN